MGIRKNRKNKTNTVFVLGGVITVVVLAAVIIILSTHSAHTPPSAGPSASAKASPEAPYVRITVSGAAFSPAVELAAGSGATVTWLVEESGAAFSGLSPVMDFGETVNWHVRMTAADSAGNDALGDIVTFNLGFDYTQDAGKYNIGSGYNHPPQRVTAVEGISNMKHLLRFLAATPSLAGPADFSGMSRLEYIECFDAALTSVDLTGCDSLIRLCVENNDLAAIDLNPVSKNLRDLRLSGNRSTVTLAPLQSPMLALYHYCAQSITVVNHPSADQLPVVEELWDWKSGQTGEHRVTSSAVRSVMTYKNGWTSADLTGQFPAGRVGHFDAHGCRLTSVTLTDCAGLISLDLHDNLLGQAAVDGVLAEAASWGTYGGSLNLAGNASPSPAGESAADILRSRGWTVTL